MDIYLIVGQIALFSRGIALFAWSLGGGAEFSALLIDQRVRTAVGWYAQHQLVAIGASFKIILDGIVLKGTADMFMLSNYMVCFLALTMFSSAS